MTQAMTWIQNGGYFGLKTNYCVYLCCLEFLSRINCPSFFLSISASEESIKGAEIDCSTPQIKMATLKEVVSIFAVSAFLEISVI